MTTNKQLRELAEKATTGPWGWDGPVWEYDAENEAPWLIQEQGVGVVITGDLQCSRANAEYIAAASPEVITALLDENEALQAECENLRAAMIEAKGHISHYMYGGSIYREPAAKAVAIIDAALQEERNP